MTLDAILNDWSEYDRKKKREQRSIEYFDFNADWEVDYLQKKIKSIYSFIPDAIIRNKIKAYARSATKPCKRIAVVKQVLIELNIPL